MLRRGAAKASEPGTLVPSGSPAIASFLERLPFPLTGAQQRCITEIGTAMQQDGPPMDRLLQGDVGSGKTVVALVALLSAVAAGYQGAIMAPTEVLAEQHFNTVSSLLDGLLVTEPEDSVFSVQLEPLPSQFRWGCWWEVHLPV